ncbi:hypothetical protein ES707_22421 [subsurface metagenome]
MTKAEIKYINNRFNRIEKMQARLMIAIQISMTKEEVTKLTRAIAEFENPPRIDPEKFHQLIKNQKKDDN